MTEKKCYKCGSNKIIPSGRLKNLIKDNGHIQLQIYTDPSALFFKGAMDSEVRADVCGSCGYIETRIKNPEKLWDYYKGFKTKKD